MRPRFEKLRQLFSTPNETPLLPKRRPLRLEPLEARRVLSVGTLHVDADSPAGTPDGQAWETAYPDLQEALDQAATLNTDAIPENNITQIWIAEGTYKPTAQTDPTDPRTATFSMLDSVSLYGSFYGDEPDLDSRHGEETILSGDLDADGRFSGGDAYTVVYVSELTSLTIDTVTITGVNDSLDGGGVHNDGGTLTITGSTISGNWAESDGGGIYNSGVLTIYGSTISGNWAESDGGGIYNSGVLTIYGSTISANSARLGAAIHNDSGTLTVTSSTISGNSAYFGGGIYNFSGTAGVTNSTLSGNSGDLGGGIFNASGTLTVANSTISGNSGRQGGGIDNSGTLTVTNSTISGNSASDTGSGISNRYPGTLTLSNSIVSLNADSDGADITGPLAATSGFNLIGVDPRFVRNPSPNDTGDLHLRAESPAINVGNNSAVPPELVIDLDGLPRIHNGRVDVGAYEYQADPPVGRDIPSAMVTTLADTVSLYDGLVSLREALFYGSVEEIGGPITFDATLGGSEITLAGNSLSVDRSVQIDASTLGSLSVNADSQSRVFTILADAVDLIGLTITGGSAGKGGGILNCGTLTVSDSTIWENSANYGGGIYNNNGTLTVTNSTISNNSANGIYNSGTLTVTDSTISGNATGGIHHNFGTLTVTGSTISDNSSYLGGGIYSLLGTVAVNDSTISGNSASGRGAGVYIYTSTMTVDNSTISGNSASGDVNSNGGGGGIYNSEGTLAVTDSTISDNSAYVGGGIYSGGTLTVTDSTISNNSASEGGYNKGGGGIYNHGIATITDSTIFGNLFTGSAEGGGGGISNYGGMLAVTNLTISGNSARRGGGIDNRFGTLKVTSSSIVGNSATDGGGISDSGTLTLHNSIIALNKKGEIGFGGGSVSASHSLIGIDPKFVRDPSPGPDGQWGTEDDDFGDLHLTGQSPAIDLGDDALAVDPNGNPLSVDLDGNPRIHGPTVDIGAYEFQGDVPPGREAASLVVDNLDDLVDLYDGQISLREAILYTDGDGLGTEITFDPSLDGGQIDLGGVAIYMDRAAHINASALNDFTINAQGNSRVLANLAESAELSGLTITGGVADDGGGIYNVGTLTVTGSTISGNSASEGGGISNIGGTITVIGTTISGNSASEGGGGGIRNVLGTLTVIGSAISGNSAGWDGGGIYDGEGTLTVIGSTISGNSADWDGGGIRSYKGTLTVAGSTISGSSARRGSGICSTFGTLTVTGSTISGNSTRENGGGIYVYHGTLTAANSAISNNLAGWDGGGIYGRGTLTVTDSTISGNSAGGGGGGISNYQGTLTAHNTILAGNTADTNGPDAYGLLKDTSFHNLIGDASGMSGIVDGVNGNLVGTAESPIDPRFVRMPSPGPDAEWGTEDDDYGDLNLLPDSPAIDAGDDAWAVDAEGNPLLTDLDGKPRISGQRVDMGAYEFLWTLYWDEDGPGSWSDPARWVDVDGGQLTFFPNNAGTAAVVREDVVSVPSDAEVYSLSVESGQVRVEVGQTLAIAGELAVPDVSLAGSEALIVGEGSVALGVGSSLSLAAGDFLGDFSQREWGDCTRSIITVGGGVSGMFDVGPAAGTHLGFGVFATDLGANLQPVSYAVDAVLVDLFQAAPGDTDGNRKVEGWDILSILQAGLFGDGVTAEAVWGNGDFNADHKVSGEDILALLQTGLFGDGTYGGELCDPPVKSASVKTDWIGQFEAVRHGKPARHSRPQRAVDEALATMGF